MATTAQAPPVELIGEAAGIVWGILHDEGKMTFARLVKEADLPRDLVMQAIGWLAREGKLHVEDVKRTRYVSLAD